MSDDPLDQVNRAAISVVALLVVFACLLLVLLAWAEPGATIGRIEDFASWLNDHNDDETKILLSLGALVIVLLMVGVMIIELTPSPTQVMRIRDVNAGGATISTAEIAARVEEEVRAVPGVAQAQAVVAAHGDRVEVVLDLQVRPEADLSRTADEACRRAHTLVEEGMAVPLKGLPRARLRYRELQLRQQSASMAASAPATGWERPNGTDDGGN